MSDIHSTCYRYEAVCTELGVKQHPYIVTMLEKEKEETIFEFKDNMFLYLAGNNKLLTDVRLGDEDAHVLYKTLQNNQFVISIDLRYNNFTDKGAQFLAKLIEENGALKDINVMCNDIGPEGGEAIARSLQNNETLKSLRLSGNKIGNRGGMAFAQVLQVNSTLENLDLGDCDLTIESIIALSTVLNNNSTLKSLNINRPILFTHQEETTVHFAKMLKVNMSLEELHLQKYDMRDFGAIRLADNLMENHTLLYLDLSCNRITRDGALELAKVLKNNTAIKVLDLGYNRLEDDGACHIAEALATYNTNLETLVVSFNNIGNKGLCALADSLKVNTSLTNIYIWGNKLEEPATIAYASLLESGRIAPQNTDIQSYVVDGVTKLCERNTTIRRHYYYAPSYGDDIPKWQPRGKNPRGSNIVAIKDLTVY